MNWFKKKNKNKDCCGVQIEEVKKEKSSCCNVKIEEVDTHSSEIYAPIKLENDPKCCSSKTK
ncbi:hypothetical protein [Rummeliibacillus stabekisii]|uniref:hypothetical protein n=1 Tax=Rummeliibacillus stabekisii TaxID=241244 RepID=UPI0037119A5F